MCRCTCTYFTLLLPGLVLTSFICFNSASCCLSVSSGLNVLVGGDINNDEVLRLRLEALDLSSEETKRERKNYMYMCLYVHIG